MINVKLFRLWCTRLVALTYYLTTHLVRIHFSFKVVDSTYMQGKPTFMLINFCSGPAITHSAFNLTGVCKVLIYILKENQRYPPGLLCGAR